MVRDAKCGYYSIKLGNNTRWFMKNRAKIGCEVVRIEMGECTIEAGANTEDCKQWQTKHLRCFNIAK